MRRFEKIGMSRQQSEALTEHLTEVLVINKEKISEAFVTRGALERVCCSPSFVHHASTQLKMYMSWQA